MSSPFNRGPQGPKDEFNPFVGTPRGPVGPIEKAAVNQTAGAPKSTLTQPLIPTQGLARAPSQSPFADKDPSPVEVLLHWLQNRWRRDTISWKELRIWSPNRTRKPDTALELARILAAHGWLVPETPSPNGSRYKVRRWRIVRDEGSER